MFIYYLQLFVLAVLTVTEFVLPVFDAKEGRRKPGTFVPLLIGSAAFLIALYASLLYVRFLEAWQQTVTFSGFMTTLGILLYFLIMLMMGSYFTLSRWKKMRENFTAPSWPENLVLLILAVFLPTSALVTQWYFTYTFVALAAGG